MVAKDYSGRCCMCGKFFGVEEISWRCSFLYSCGAYLCGGCFALEDKILTAALDEGGIKKVSWAMKELALKYWKIMRMPGI